MSDENTPVILTIDDEEIIREMILDFLECFDYKVLEAENGREGLCHHYIGNRSDCRRG